MNKTPKVLWISPALNAYKLRFLTFLSESARIPIEIFAGQASQAEGHRFEETPSALPVFTAKAFKKPVTFQWFAFHPSTYVQLFGILWRRRYDVVLMPIEKKHLPMILWLLVVRKFFGFRVISYNHPCLRSAGRVATGTDMALSRLIFGRYDRVVFYTEQGRQWAVNEGLISASKAGFANNTLDTSSIWQEYSFEIEDRPDKTILFIGRLIDNKGIDKLIEYFQRIKTRLPTVSLHVVGDGPLAGTVRAAAETDSSIRWLGATVDEAEIAEHMRQANLVFVPGSSGLAIVHAFCYGKPFVTLAGGRFTHGPEIDYLVDGENGLILDGQCMDSGARRIVELLCDADRYRATCQAAFSTAKNISIDSWAKQMSAQLKAAACA